MLNHSALPRESDTPYLPGMMNQCLSGVLKGGARKSEAPQYYQARDCWGVRQGKHLGVPVLGTRTGGASLMMRATSIYPTR